MRNGRNWVAFALVATVLLVLRLPSFAEPAWYPDEGTYADIGYALAHGAHLYVNAWDNKPPGVYWVGWLIATHGSPQVWFAAAAFLCAAISCLAVYGITTNLRGRVWGTTAALSMAVLISLPTLDGDLFNAEPAGAAAVAVAMWLVITKPRRGALTPAAAGGLAAVAFIFKAVFALDLCAIGAVIWLSARHKDRGKRWRQIGVLLIGFAVVIAAASCVLLASGSLGPAIHVLVAADTGYVGSANSSGGVFGWVRVGIPLIVTGFLVFRWRRKHPAVAAMVLWLGLDLCGSVISPRGFTHYIQQALPALCIVVALFASWLWKSRPRRLAAVLLLLLQPVVCLLLLWIPRAQTALQSGAGLPKFEAGNFVARQLGPYYVNGYGSLFGNATSQTNFDALVPVDLAKQHMAVQWFSQHSHPGEQVFVWGSIHWSYVLSQRVPAGRYVTLNSAYYLEPNAQDLLLADLGEHFPAVLIADGSLPPSLQTTLSRRHYVRYRGVVAGDDVWISPSKSPNSG